MVINGILGALVGVTGGCAIVTPVEAVFIGIVGAFLANITSKLLLYLKVDDAVGATCVHGKSYTILTNASKNNRVCNPSYWDGLSSGGFDSDFSGLWIVLT
jgi:ammonia channel protein AmtB